MPLPFFIAHAALGALSAVVGGATAAAAGAAAGAAATGSAATAGAIAAAYGINANIVKDFVTTDEAVILLGMSKPTLLKKIKEGLIPYDGAGGRGGFRISRQALEEYAKSINTTLNWEALKKSSKPKNDTDKKAVKEMIKLKELQKEEAELELEELELDATDTIEYKRSLIQAKKKIKALDTEIQAWNMILKTEEDEPKE